jgi:hypothetical protein
MFKWTVLELFAENNQLNSVRYLLTGTDNQFTVSSEGNHIFSYGIVNKSLDQIVESDILQWLEKDISQDGVNPIKLAIENQLNSLNNVQKVDFPWLSGTFTI